MAYTRVNWEDAPSTATPRNAANLNKMDKGIKDLEDSLSSYAPKSHASSDTTYGVGTTTNYGHCKVENDLTAASYSDGVALSAYQGKLLNDNKAPKSHASTTNTYGLGSTTNYGHCKTINNLTTSSHSDGNALSAYQGYVLSERNTYSTTEKAIGKWRDGKTLYRKSFTFTNKDINVATWTTVVSVSGMNIETLVDCKLYNNKMVWFGYLTRISSNNLQVFNGLRDGADWPANECVIEYTKV